MEFKFHTPPFEHQKKLFDEFKDSPYHGIFWEMGGGKTKPIIDKTVYLYFKGLIDTLVVVAPEGVHLNWITDEIPAHLLPEVLAHAHLFCWQSKKHKTKTHQNAAEEAFKYKGGLLVVAMTPDAVMTDGGRDYLWKLLSKRRCFYGCDESTFISKPKNKTTKRIVASAKYAPYRFILNGTPVPHSPFDVYSQMKFLKEDFWRIHELDNFTVFKNHFGRWQEIERTDGQKFPLLQGYRRLEELAEIISYSTSRLTKDQIFDLPKLYAKRPFQLTNKQMQHYEELDKDLMTWLGQRTECTDCGGAGSVVADGSKWECGLCNGSGQMAEALIKADLTIVKMLRMHQLTRGYLPKPDGTMYYVDDENPALESTRAFCKEVPHAGIIWARFDQDIDILMDMLKKEGQEAVRYDGKVSVEQRAKNKEAFQKNDVKWFVSKPAVGGRGLTLLRAKTTMYYSQDFNYDDRKQSEDRNHRIGQDVAPLYVDLMAFRDLKETIDHHLVKNLRAKDKNAAIVLRDAIKEWI